MTIKDEARIAMEALTHDERHMLLGWLVSACPEETLRAIKAITEDET